MKVCPLTSEPLPAGIIIVLKEHSIFWLNSNMINRRLRIVIEDYGNCVKTDVLDSNDPFTRNIGTWDKEDIDGFITREDLDKFLVWETLKK